jgi:S-methyl-5-thioribose-1-phosphate isomerase
VKVAGKDWRTVWMENASVFFIEQNLLPFKFRIGSATTYTDCCVAIKTMNIRGAGALGAMAGFAMALAFLEAPEDHFMEFVKKARGDIESTRPTARNLFYATEKVLRAGLKSRDNAIEEAQKLADEDIRNSRAIGELGNQLIMKGNGILTHCNAGWLAFVDYGTALSPVYLAHESGKNIFVYVDETRPRSQGARLTAWELFNAGVPHAIIPDNAAASLMSKGLIHLVITGADRIAANGDVANKIGTLEKAIAAKEYNIPFYVAAPSSTFDLKCRSGAEIIIEERTGDEVLYQEGPDSSGNVHKILVCSPGSPVLNPGFDITPAKYITGIITEKGIIRPTLTTIKKYINT